MRKEMPYSHPRQSFRLALLGLFVATSVVTAQGPDRGQPIRLQAVTPTPQRLTPSQGRGAFEGLRRGRNTATVLGIVHNTLGQLVPAAGTVLVRNLGDGTVAGHAEVDGLAQFRILGLDPGTYTAELVGQSGSIITTSSAFSASSGDIIQLAPVVPIERESALMSALRHATSSIVTSAASAGIIAIDPGQPVSPQQP